MNESQLSALKDIKELSRALFPETVVQKRIIEMIEQLAEEIEEEETRKKDE